MPAILYIVGRGTALSGPNKRTPQGFITTQAFDTLAEAIDAAKFDYEHNVSPGARVEYVVYKADDGNALVELREPGQGVFHTIGFYKIVVGEETPVTDGG